jgi:hypothetical protein
MANRYLIEKCLVEHCSATLASMKSANLFNMTFVDDTDIEEQIEFWNQCMKEKGIRLYILRRQENRVLVYVYRKKQLEVSLNRPGVAKFLKQYGYGSTDVEYALDRLKSRIGENNEFPHEIGIFLDYPLGDVIGFIKNAGQNCKCVGCWKVYCNECEAIKAFARFKKCTSVYVRLWNQGRSVRQLTVAA